MIGLVCSDRRGQRMKLRHFLTTTLLAASLALLACSTPPTNSNQRNTNSNSSQSNASQSSSSQNKPVQQSTTTGSIEVDSVPPGASVLLVSTDEGGAGEPQRKGSTPTTITGLSPGKYTVDLEKTGYKFSQKEVTVKSGSTTRVNATLKRQ